MGSEDEKQLHLPVLLNEVLDLLQPKAGEVVIDATLGLGGHSEAMLKAGAVVLGIDRDRAAMETARKRLSVYGERFKSAIGQFSHLRDIAQSAGISTADIILADLGVSSFQFDTPERGFSFRSDALLDMRMDQTSGPTAAEILAEYDENEIANIIYRYGEERYSRRIARRIVERREAGRPINTTLELADLVERALPRRPDSAIHPATKTFQALRIAVNDEMGELEKFLEVAPQMLKIGGRIGVISFHSLEDRAVKQAFRRLSGKCECPPRIPECRCGAIKMLKIFTKKPVVASASEVASNPRSRSAKLRAAVRIS